MRKNTTRALALLVILVLTLGILPATIQAAPAEQTSPEPVLYLDMEEIQSNKLTNKVDGTEISVGGTIAQDTSINRSKALRFDGTTYINLEKRVNLTNAYTLAGWFCQDAGATDGQALFSRGNSGAVKDQLAVLVKNGRIYHMVANGAGNSTYHEFSTEAQAPAEQWHHVAVTRNGAQVTIYIDGAAVKTGTISDKDFVEATLPMYIGMDCNDAGELYARHAFKGLMDELQIYDAALTQEQIVEQYESVRNLKLVEFQNGSLKLRLTNAPENAPAQKDFTLQAAMDGKNVVLNVTNYEYDAQTQNAVFTFEPLVNHTNREQTVTCQVVYDGWTVTGEFRLSAGDNQNPVVSEAKIVNLSTKLGAEPHVKGMLEVTYNYTDADQDPEGETKYQWFIADTKDGPYTKLQGINTKTIILINGYEGKYLKCNVMPRDCHGNIGNTVVSAATDSPVQHTEGNPLTDWFHEAKYGISHHFLANYFNADDVYREEREKWDIQNVSWNDFISQFDVEKYAAQVHETGAKFVTLTMGQNNGYYVAPSETYDKYMREAGLLQEGQTNPMTTQFDLPMEMAKALAKYDIKLMLYLPANPPHSAHWNTEGSSGWGFIGDDYKVTTDVFDYTPAEDGIPSQKARKVVHEMVREWSLRYGDLVAGWWFDGVFKNSSGLLDAHADMSQEYNIAGLANAAKAGNPYSIVTFNPGIGNPVKTNEYQDYMSGEKAELEPVPTNPGRWTADSDDCQKYMFGVLGSQSSWKNGWGCKGTSKDTQTLIDRVSRGIENNCTMGMDIRVNVFGELDPEQFEQMIALKVAIRNNGVAPAIEQVTLDKQTLTLEVTGDRGLVKPALKPMGASEEDLVIAVKDPTVAEVKLGAAGVFDVIAKEKGTTEVVFASKDNAEIRAVLQVTVNGREPVKTVDDGDANMIAYNGADWLELDRDTPDPDGYMEYNNTVHANNQVDAKAVFTFEGTGFDYLTSYNSDQGKISVQVDDREPVTVDLSVPGGASKKSFVMNAFGVYDLEKGQHTVTLTNLEQDKWFIVDAFRVYNHDHTMTHVPAKAATCVAEGNVEYWHCDGCGKNFADAAGNAVLTDIVTAIDPNNHTGNTELRNAKEATYEEEGYTGDLYCKDCQKLLEKGQVIPKKERPIDPDPDPIFPVNPIRPVKPEKPAAALPFVDVPEHQWYYDSVYSAWEQDLIDGMDQTHFAPDSTLTVAQAIKLAAVLHQRDKLGEVTLTNGTESWFSTYVKYAIANGIIDESYGTWNGVQMNQVITRAEFVKIFHGAKDSYASINQVAENAIPDVKQGDENAAKIYDFYRAGILTGSDDKGTFYPDSNIKRSEVATILIRMFDQSVREHIELS